MMLYIDDALNLLSSQNENTRTNNDALNQQTVSESIENNEIKQQTVKLF